MDKKNISTEKLAEQIEEMFLDKYFYKRKDVLIKKLNEFRNQPKCIYENKDGNCWALKAKCNPNSMNCDYRKDEE